MLLAASASIGALREVSDALRYVRVLECGDFALGAVLLATHLRSDGLLSGAALKWGAGTAKKKKWQGATWAMRRDTNE
jgi:hypothetical protein